MSKKFSNFESELPIHYNIMEWTSGNWHNRN